MNLKNLSDKDLLSATQRAVRDEKEAMLIVLHHLREVERRQLFSINHSSLFDYCVHELGYDAGSAHLRISAMRLLRELPEMEEKVESGALNLTLLAQAQTFIRKERIRDPEKKKAVLQSIEGKSTREAQKELIEQSANPDMHLPEKVRPVSKTHSEIRIVVDDALLARIQELQALLAHARPGASIKEVLEYAVGETLKRETPKKPLHAHEVTPRQSEAEIRRVVWHRDDGRCTYRTPKGERCDSRHAIEYDHARPVARGGSTTVENLRLRCRVHNRRAAIEHFGHRKIARYVHAMGSIKTRA